MSIREQFLELLRFSGRVPPPRYESEFSDEVIQAWRSQGVLDERTPEAFFGLDAHESLPVEFGRRSKEKLVVQSEADLPAFRRRYDPSRSDIFPADWNTRLEAWHRRDFPLAFDPWNDGFFQIIGIRDGATLGLALSLLCEKPALAEAQMEHYTGYLETLIDRVVADVVPDYALFYEPIASNHGAVISPEMYRRFVWQPLRSIVDRLERHGVAFRFMWTAGRVTPLIPLWMDAGINGIALNRGAECGIGYARLRTEFGSSLRLLGGIDWRSVMEGPHSIDAILERDVRPLLEQGGYIPHLDDTIRSYMPFDHFRYYRERLDHMLQQMFE